MSRWLLALLLLLAASACATAPTSVRLETGAPIYGITLAAPGPVSADALEVEGLERVTEAEGRLSGERPLDEYAVERLVVWLAPDGSGRPAALLLSPRDFPTFHERCTGELIGDVAGLGAITRMRESAELYCVDAVRADEERLTGGYGAVLWTREFEAVAPRLGAFVPLVQLGKRWHEAFARGDVVTLAADRLLWLRADRTLLPEIAAYDPAIQAAEGEAKEKAAAVVRAQEEREALALSRLDPALVAACDRCPLRIMKADGRTDLVDGPAAWRAGLARGELSSLLPALEERLAGVNERGEWSADQLGLLEKFRGYVDAARLTALARRKRVTAARLTLLLDHLRGFTPGRVARFVGADARAQADDLLADAAQELLPLRLEDDGPLRAPLPFEGWPGVWIRRSTERRAAKDVATISHAPSLSVARSATTKKERFTEEYRVEVPVGDGGSGAPTAAGPAPGSARSEQLLSRLDELDAAIAIQRERARTGAGDRAASAGVANPGYDPTSPRSEPFSAIQGGGLSGSAAWRIQDAEAELRRLEAEKAAIEGELTRGAAPRGAAAPRRTKWESRTRSVERELPAWDAVMHDTIVLRLPDGTQRLERCDLQESFADWGELKTEEDAKRVAWKRFQGACSYRIQLALLEVLHARARGAAELEPDRCEAAQLRTEFAPGGQRDDWLKEVCFEP